MAKETSEEDEDGEIISSSMANTTKETRRKRMD
ncbi:hypothetical protein CCACVL1_03729 [Corchorus capsularis]|uniref:Uncharacterized protein n=1 Tax=Corchorus capsularis TaxID=210143 RepID=A0A1R3JY11_COCAP|nr:hypothetical protein CCACVL1_03729 [Corchorus capsularis]